MADVSKDTLRKEIAAILKNADLTKTSAKKVRQQLEEKLEVDLADQKKVVDELVMEVLKDKKGDKKKKDDSDEDGEEDGDEENGAGENEDDDDEEDSESEKKKAPKRPAPKKKKDSESEEGSEDDDEDEYSPKKKAKGGAKKAAAKGRKKKGSESDSDEDWAKKKKKTGGAAAGGGAKKGKGGGGYTKACTLSPELASLVGQESMPRHEVVKKIWSIIKERNLYDPKNKQFAICDNDLQKVFGVKRFRTFGMMKHLKDHFIS